jgi:hypothetical protein
MQTLMTYDRAQFAASHQRKRRWCRRLYVTSLLVAMLMATVTLTGCGGSTGTTGVIQYPTTITGNWQFTVAAPPDGSFQGGLQGGFLIQSGTSVTGGAFYSVSLPGLTIPCNTGSATITGSKNSSGVWTLTAIAGTQTFTFTGTLSLDGFTMSGTYTSTAGTAGDGSPCGTAQAGLQWSAASVPTVTGALQGSFHSTGGGAGLINQDFLVTGGLTQGANTGGGSAVVTGTLTFLNPVTNVSDYPCLVSANVSGLISGNMLILEITGSDGSVIGQMGEPIGSFNSTGINPLLYNSVTGGFALQGAQPTYMVATPDCPGSLNNASNAGDYGNICLAVNSTNPCTEPITLTPTALSFPSSKVGNSSSQTVTIENVSNSTLNGLTVVLANTGASGTNFEETDNCGANGAPSQGQPFDLTSEASGLAGFSCVIKITFAPTCTAQCSSPLTATLTVNSPVSADNDLAFTVPITGTESGGSEASASSSETLAGASDASITPRDLEHYAEIE